MIMKLKYIGSTNSLYDLIYGELFRVMYNMEFSKKFPYGPCFEDDCIVRLIRTESPYKAYLILNPNDGLYEDFAIEE